MKLPFVTKELVESLSLKYQQNPNSVDKEWWKYLEDLPTTNAGDCISYETTDRAIYGEPVVEKAKRSVGGKAEVLALSLVSAYRLLGWKKAKLNPLHDKPSSIVSELDPTSWDGWKEYAGEKVDVDGFGSLTLSDLWHVLDSIYSGTLGCEVSHLTCKDERDFMLKWFEGHKSDISNDQKKRIFKVISEAVAFENFLHEKHRTAKRFGADGCESLLVILDAVINGSAHAKRVVLGMPHRGRLNVMRGIFEKPCEEIFMEFVEKQRYFSTSDVKYHSGWTCDKILNGRNVRLEMLYNPSHLEAVDGVTIGYARGIMKENNLHSQEVLPILIHGEAAIAGQGCVYEVLCMNKLDGYEVHGTIHMINDNQVGFTAEWHETRSWFYASQIAKLCDSPVIHVNGDDPNAVFIAGLQAIAFREKFGKSIFINIVSYRRYGHNEGDEPMFTQPLMYKQIKDHKDVASMYGSELISQGVITEASADSYISGMRKEFDKVKESAPLGQGGDLEPMGEFPSTSISKDKVKHLVRKLVEVPSSFNCHKNIIRMMDFRKDFIEGKVSADWALGEALALASLLDEGHHVRISGQDSVRGTFSHRHSILADQENNQKFCIFGGFNGDFEASNSPLSEEAVVAFEYGYSLARKTSLNIWEAQFGDFANGAQIVTDEFLVSGEEKWNQCSNLTLLLPHSSDGQGPDHSSARIERFLQLCAKDNMRVVYPTTPAGFFHLLKGQVQSSRPLIIMTPKSMLRHPKCVSEIEDFGGAFQPVISDDKIESAKTLVICSGKIYYDLHKARDDLKADSFGICRLEQIYPRPTKELTSLLRSCRKLEKVVWCQEEPVNMGCWSFVKDWLTDCLLSVDIELNPLYVGRECSSSPAVGLHSVHAEEQKGVIERVFR